MNERAGEWSGRVRIRAAVAGVVVNERAGEWGSRVRIRAAVAGVVVNECAGEWGGRIRICCRGSFDKRVPFRRQYGRST